MEPRERHEYIPHLSFDGGDLDCGGGLLLLIRRHMDRLEAGQLLEIRSTEVSVDEELPAWCRMTRNDLVSWTRHDRQRSFLVARGAFDPTAADGAARAAQLDDDSADFVQDGAEMHLPHAPAGPRMQSAAFVGHAWGLDGVQQVAVDVPESLPPPMPAPLIPELAVMGIGSWPRPRWMLAAIHQKLRGVLDEGDFQTTADDAVRLAVAAQQRAGVAVLNDGEQRRDSYASFVGARLDNVAMVTLADVAAMVDDPEAFQEELRALDVPAQEVRHPVPFGPLGRSRPLALHELEFVRGISDSPVKIALPGPYLLSRTMWLECLRVNHYPDRESLARDVVRVLREEIHFLLAAGAALVQLDEPVLTEVVFTGPRNSRSFMCGALSEKSSPDEELELALHLLRETLAGLPRERLAMHVCRGNWTRDESVLLRGGYAPLLPLLRDVPVGTLLLEFATDRAGDLALLADLPEDKRVGVGLVNPKHEEIEDIDAVAARAAEAMKQLGRDRLLLVPDCGFATFADNPVASATVAEAKLAVLAQAAKRLG